MVMKAIYVILFLIFAPFIGGLLDGIDRIISARMQRRKGPSIFQPFYDLGKLFSKEMIAVNNVQLLLNLSYLVILVIAGAMLFAGADLLMVLFILSTADMFLIMAASSDSSPYANMGASREMMQMMAYEPLTLLVAVGFYLTTGSFHVGTIIQQPVSAVLWMPGLLVGFMFTAAIKFRSGDGQGHHDGNVRNHAGDHEYRGILRDGRYPGDLLPVLREQHLVELDRGACDLFYRIPDGDALGQYQRPPEMEDRALWLLGGDPGCRRREHTDLNAGQIGGRQLWQKCQNHRGCSTMTQYDIERFGVINTGDPFQADIFLITGGVNSQTESVVKQIYSQMPEPKVVVAVGICACTGGVFKECYNIKGGIDTVIPVDVYVPGCAARPEAIIDGVLKALKVLDAKQAALEAKGR